MPNTKKHDKTAQTKWQLTCADVSCRRENERQSELLLGRLIDYLPLLKAPGIRRPYCCSDALPSFLRGTNPSSAFEPGSSVPSGSGSTGACCSLTGGLRDSLRSPLISVDTAIERSNSADTAGRRSACADTSRAFWPEPVST